ncbi:MAG: ABC transporter ATP-binding protein [Planctomyces sp.]|nr:ABC transporter ATP-binding protein [Planctomyces sp.]
MAVSLVSVRELSHRYGGTHALQKLSFEITESSLWGLLGPNGSGKSTLFRILSTLLPVQSGEAYICGASLKSHQGVARRNLAVCFQTPALDVRLTGLENLKCQAALYGLTGVQVKDRVKELGQRLAISDVLGAAVSTLSGGFRRRIELAKALLHRPRVLLLDEPTTGLDVHSRIEFWKILKSLRDDYGTTVIVSTHLMEEADQCDQLLMLNRGVIAAQGSPVELRSRMTGERLRIRCRSVEAVLSQLVSRLGSPTSQHGDEVIWHTQKAGQRLSALVDSCRDDLLSIELSQPTLEDVFLTLTGSSLVEASDSVQGG